MDRTLIGRVAMAVGAVLTIFGLISMVSGGGGGDNGDDAAVVAMTSTSSTTTSTTTTSTTTTSTTTTSTTTTSTTTTSTTTTSTTTTTTLAPETAEEFLASFNQAFDSGDVAFLVGRLSQATIERYGFDQCNSHLTTILPQSQGLEMRRLVGVGPWDYVTDNVTTSLGDVTAVEVDRLVNGETLIQELHWQLVAGSYTWFTDCGDPLIID